MIDGRLQIADDSKSLHCDLSSEICHRCKSRAMLAAEWYGTEDSGNLTRPNFRTVLQLLRGGLSALPSAA